MPERKARSKEQSLWLVLVWVVTLAAMVGLGILLGKYVLSYCASSLQTPRSSQTPSIGSTKLAGSDLQSSATSVSPISPQSQEAPSATTEENRDVIVTEGQRLRQKQARIQVSLLLQSPIGSSMIEVKQRESDVC